MSHLREGAWINANTGQWSWIDEHADWAKRAGNLTSIGLPESVWKTIADLPNDHRGSRERILRKVMEAGGIRMRARGDVVVIEFTVPLPDALRAARPVLHELAGELTLCRFTDLQSGDSLLVYHQDYEQHVENDIEWLLRTRT